MSIVYINFPSFNNLLIPFSSIVYTFLKKIKYKFLFYASELVSTNGEEYQCEAVLCLLRSWFIGFEWPLLMSLATYRSPWHKARWWHWRFFGFLWTRIPEPRGICIWLCFMEATLPLLSCLLLTLAMWLHEANTYFLLKSQGAWASCPSLQRHREILAVFPGFLVLVSWEVDWTNGEIESAHVEFPLSCTV